MSGVAAITAHARGSSSHSAAGRTPPRSDTTINGAPMMASPRRCTSSRTPYCSRAPRTSPRKPSVATDGFLGEVRGALEQYGVRDDVHRLGEAIIGAPLMVVSLRGGVRPAAEWLDDPRACAVIAATPDMWGSRLLFRGYG